MAVDRVLRLVDVGDEVLDAALVAELDARAADALVGERDPQALGQERRLAKALNEGLRPKLDLLEDLGVGQEADRRAGLRRSSRPPSCRPGGRRARTPGGRPSRRARPSPRATPRARSRPRRRRRAGRPRPCSRRLRTCRRRAAWSAPPSAPGSPLSAITSTGMPRPWSTTVTELSGWIVTSIESLWPAIASSTALSTTS